MTIDDALNNKHKPISHKKDCIECHGTGKITKMEIGYQHFNSFLPHLQQVIEWKSDNCTVCGGKGYLEIK